MNDQSLVFLRRFKDAGKMPALRVWKIPIGTKLRLGIVSNPAEDGIPS